MKAFSDVIYPLMYFAFSVYTFSLTLNIYKEIDLFSKPLHMLRKAFVFI